MNSIGFGGRREQKPTSLTATGRNDCRRFRKNLSNSPNSVTKLCRLSRSGKSTAPGCISSRTLHKPYIPASSLHGREVRGFSRLHSRLLPEVHEHEPPRLASLRLLCGIIYPS